jgi:alpha-L-fucosidase
MAEAENKLAHTFLVLAENDGFKVYQLWLQRQAEACRKEANDMLVFDNETMVKAAHLKGMAEAYQLAKEAPEKFKVAEENERLLKEYQEKENENGRE